MTIIPHMYDNFQINQISKDTLVGSTIVPLGYVNLTEMAKANTKKKVNDYFRLKATTEYIEEFARSTGIPVDVLVITIEDGKNETRGTWAHCEIAIDFASWLSPKFRVWANRVLRLVIQGDYTANTAEAHEAYKRLDEMWAEIRAAGKVTRRTLTDAIRDYYKRNPVEADVLIEKKCKLTPWMLEYWQYGHPTDKMYLAIFGMKAKQLEAYLQVKRHEARNQLSDKCLKQVDWMEDTIAKMIDNRDIHPSKAVKLAVTLTGIKPMSVEAKVVVPNV